MCFQGEQEHGLIWHCQLFSKHHPNYFVNTVTEVHQIAEEVPALLNQALKQI